MTILFLGQLGINLSPTQPSSARNYRIEHLVRLLAQKHHNVIVTASPRFTSTSITSYHGVTIKKHRFRWLSLWTLWRQQPQVIHLHSWFLTPLMWLIALLSPESTIIWTIDTPSPFFYWLTKLLMRQADSIADTLTTTSRQLQYETLVNFGVRTKYIPDGFTPPLLPDIPSKKFGLNKGKYCVVLADQAVSLKTVLQAYKATKTRKKLVIFHESTPATARLKRRYPFVHFMSSPTSRPFRSLLRQAAVVIIADEQPTTEPLLQAMAGSRIIIASTAPLHQETLGVHGYYYVSTDKDGLIEALKKALSTSTKQKSRGLAAKKRATLHFTWQRVASDYLQAYKSIKIPTNVDSIQNASASLPVGSK